MTQRIATLAAAAALTLGGIAAVPAATNAHSSDAPPQAQTSCKRAKIGGKSRCIAAGQFCARRHQKDYLRYGYSCSKRDRRGNWHLTYA